MKIKVKVIQGPECIVDVIPTESIFNLKSKVQNLLGIDIDQQILLLKGKALFDENPISFYPGIKEGAKISLLIRKAEQSSVSQSVQGKPGLTHFQNEIIRVLKQYYRENEAKSIAAEIATEIKTKAHYLSYDDLERLATTLIQDQENLA